MESHEQSEALQGRVARSQLEEGVFLARNGDRESARAVFTRLIRRSPEDEQAWLWLAYVSETPEEGLRYLAEARAFLPESESLAEAERQARARLTETEAKDASPREPLQTAGEKGAAAAKDAMRRAGEAAKGLSGRWDGAQASQAAREKARTAGDGFRQAARNARERLPDGDDLAKAAHSLPEVARWAVFCIAIFAIAAFLWLGGAPLLTRGSARTIEPLVLADAPAVDASAYLVAPASVWAEGSAELEAAWESGQWRDVERQLDALRLAGCPDEDSRTQLAEAYRQVALEYLDEGAPEDANRALNWAVRLNAGSAELQETRRAVDLYLQGVHAYGARDWAGVVSALRVVERLTPDFRDTRMMLADAYLHEGERVLAEADASGTGFEDGLYDRALAYAERAIEMRAGDYPEAKDLLTRVNDAIFPPKRIEVELGRFRVTAFENHQPIRTMTVCVGRPSAPTLPGRYKIMNKIPMAYASQWDLQMPNWMGIYYAGVVQNGFHALPFLSSGARLWTQALGTRCSFGCIVIGVEDSDWLYEWSDVGDVVIIKP